MRHMSLLNFILMIAALALLGVMLTKLSSNKKEYNRMKARLEQIDSTYLRKSGGTTSFGPKGLHNKMLNYDLRSWDGGQNWYAVELDTKTDPWGIKILGEAEKVYPGLMKHLEAWDKMTKRALENGPLDFSNPEDAKVLNEAGFTAVREKE